MHDLHHVVKEIAERLKVINKTFSLDEKSKELIGLEAKSIDPNLWDDQENARKVIVPIRDYEKDIKALKAIIEKESAGIVSSAKKRTENEIVQTIDRGVTNKTGLG